MNKGLWKGIFGILKRVSESDKNTERLGNVEKKKLFLCKIERRK